MVLISQSQSHSVCLNQLQVTPMCQQDFTSWVHISKLESWLIFLKRQKGKLGKINFPSPQKKTGSCPIKATKTRSVQISLQNPGGVLYHFNGALKLTFSLLERF